MKALTGDAATSTGQGAEGSPSGADQALLTLGLKQSALGVDASVMANLSFEEEFESSKPFGRRLQEAVTWLLIDAEDLMPHLEAADPDRALYVGRRVDQAWRRVEHFASNWLGETYQDVDHELWMRDL